MTGVTNLSGASTATGLAMLRAKHALEKAGLDAAVELTRASSVTNEVWLTTEFAIRVNRRLDQRLRREAQLARSLPDEVRYPEVVAFGTDMGFDWLVARRRRGNVLSRCWPTMAPSQRRVAVRQFAFMLRTLHRTVAPSTLEDIANAPQLLRGGALVPPVAPLLDAIEQARQLPHVDRGLMDSTKEIVRRTARTIEPFESRTLIHGDLTFENVLWDGEQITSLIDFEWSRPAPPDLDLDVFLRFCAYPHLHVAADYERQTKPADYEDVPWWLREDYPQLFGAPSALDRLRLYAIAFDVRELLTMPPTGPARELAAHHPLNRLVRDVNHRSHLDLFAQPGSDAFSRQ
jgi:aminoglycoside phosphotransferase (APT) family kinase protein